MKNLFLYVVFFSVSFLLYSCIDSKKIEQDFDGVVVNIDTNSIKYVVDSKIFGICLMYWSEEDNIMEEGFIEDALKNIPCGFLRFPGGTDSDGYLWDEHRLADDKRWPFIDGEQTMDTDEFIALCRKTNAIPIICCNTEIAFFDSPEKAEELAAGWVKYCNIDNDYDIKYWELGNEPYYHTRFNGIEYANLFNRMSIAMKKVDPDIMVGAVGEWNTKYSGMKSEIDPSKWKEVQEIEYQFETGQWDLLSKIHSYRTIKDGPSWWKQVLEIAGDNVDFLSTHWYYDFSQLEVMENETGKLKNLCLSITGKELPIATTEWNLHEGIEAKGMKRAVAVSEALGRMLDGGVTMSNIWPFRCQGEYHGKKSLLNWNDNSPTANYWVFKQFATLGNMTRIESESVNDSIYHYACKDNKGVYYVMLINRYNVDIDVIISDKNALSFNAGIISPSFDDPSNSVSFDSLYCNKGKITVPAFSTVLCTSDNN